MSRTEKKYTELDMERMLLIGILQGNKSVEKLHQEMKRVRDNNVVEKAIKLITSIKEQDE